MTSATLPWECADCGKRVRSSYGGCPDCGGFRLAPALTATTGEERSPALGVSTTETADDDSIPRTPRWWVHRGRGEPLWRCRDCGTPRRKSFGACTECGQHRVEPADAPAMERTTAYEAASSRRPVFRLGRRSPDEETVLSRHRAAPATPVLPLLAGAALTVPATLALRFLDGGFLLGLASLLLLGGVILSARYGRSAAGALMAGWERPDWSGAPWYHWTGRKRIFSAGIGLGLMAALVILLTFGDGGVFHLLLWAATLLLVGAGFAGPQTVRRVIAPLSTGFRSGIFTALLPTLLVSAVYCGVTVPNLTDWRYAVIGDEYSFFLGAVAVFETGPRQVFSQSGVFDHHPQLNSVYKALVMTVFGADHFGWKMSGIVSMVAAIAGVYFTGAALGGRRVGALSAAVFASSHYLMGLMNGGYNHMDSLPYIIWSVGLFVVGARQRSMLLLYLAGVLLGLGLYTHYSARLIGPVLLLFSLVWVGPRGTLRFWPVGVGFLMAAAPTVVVAGVDLWTKMAAESLGNYSREVSGPVLERLLGNVGNNLPAFFRNAYVSHYVSGPLSGPLTAVLMALGLGIAAGAVRWPAARLLLVWTATHFVLLGLLSPYPDVSITRLYPLMLPGALLAGLAADRLVSACSGLLPALAGRAGPLLVTAALVALLFTVNVHQLRTVTHEKFHYTPQTMAVGSQRNERCVGDAYGGLFLGAHPQGVLALALDSYTHGSTDARWVATLEWPADDVRPVCVVVVHPGRVRGGFSEELLRSRYPEGDAYLMRAPSGLSSMEFYTVPSHR